MARPFELTVAQLLHNRGGREDKAKQDQQAHVFCVEVNVDESQKSRGAD